MHGFTIRCNASSVGGIIWALWGGRWPCFTYRNKLESYILASTLRSETWPLTSYCEPCTLRFGSMHERELSYIRPCWHVVLCVQHTVLDTWLCRTTTVTCIVLYFALSLSLTLYWTRVSTTHCTCTEALPAAVHTQYCFICMHGCIQCIAVLIVRIDMLAIKCIDMHIIRFISSTYYQSANLSYESINLSSRWSCWVFSLCVLLSVLQSRRPAVLHEQRRRLIKLRCKSF